jgi:DNA-directed RNA polymerase sigma subunit (sigma70/sigma32)
VTGPSLPLRTESNLLRMIREARDAISLLSTGDYSNTRESQHLVAQMRIGDAARERLLTHNVWIVPAARIGLITPNAASPDWPMIGSRGLEHAMNTYDPDTSYGFTTWATWCIRCFLRSEPDQGGLTGDREPRTPYPPDRSEAIAIEPRPKED